MTETQDSAEESKQEKSKRGFALMDPEKQREIARKGGQLAHQLGRAHEFTADEAKAAGEKGGRTAHAQGRAHEFTSQEARDAGRKGGVASAAAAKARKGENA